MKPAMRLGFKLVGNVTGTDFVPTLYLAIEKPAQ